MALDQGFLFAQVSVQLEVGKNSLRIWAQQVQFERNGGVPETIALTGEQRVVQKLKVRINELERDKLILKRLPRSWCRRKSIDQTD